MHGRFVPHTLRQQANGQLAFLQHVTNKPADHAKTLLLGRTRQGADLFYGQPVMLNGVNKAAFTDDQLTLLSAQQITALFAKKKLVSWLQTKVWLGLFTRVSARRHLRAIGIFEP